jgi:hypothetical protein
MDPQTAMSCSQFCHFRLVTLRACVRISMDVEYDLHGIGQQNVCRLDAQRRTSSALRLMRRLFIEHISVVGRSYITWVSI